MAWALDGAGGGDWRRNCELWGLEWCDLDLDAGTVRFRQALTIVDPAVLPGDPDATARCKELAVGPVKSAASSAILTLPPLAIQALRPTAAARPGCAWLTHDPPPWGCAGSSPAGHPDWSSST